MLNAYCQPLLNDANSVKKIEFFWKISRLASLAFLIIKQFKNQYYLIKNV